MSPTFRRVSKAAKAALTKEEVPFEEALKKLETIVETMESEELPLEQLLTRFEEGTHLAQVCQARLTEAEVRVQKLEKTLAGGLEAKPFVPDEGVALQD